MESETRREGEAREPAPKRESGGEERRGPEEAGDGIPAMDALDPRLTEAINPRTREIDRAAPREIVDLIQAEDRQVAEAVAAEAEAVAELVERVAGRLRRGGRLFYVGAGTSGRLGVLDAAECPPTFGTDPELVQGIIAGGLPTLVRSREGVEDDRDAGRRDVREAGVSEADFVLGIATSGTTPYVRAAVREADGIGAGTGFLSCTEPPEGIREVVDVLVTPLVGPEVVAGSTRMKAGTATKLVLNTLTTGVMIRLGKVYRNLMVDLRAVSRKLADRSVRIVRLACGPEEVSEEEARRLLVSAGGSAKTAVAMRELGTERAMAERLVDAADGMVWRAIERFAGMESPPYYACYPESAPAEELEALPRRLSRGPERVRRAVEEAREHTPGTAVRTGGWTPAQHVAHLVESEREAFRPRIRRMLEGAGPESVPFDDWPPSDPPPDGNLPASELLERFRRERERTLELLEDMEERDWNRRLSVDGEVFALHQFVRGIRHHDEAHAARIRERIHPDLLRDSAGSSDSGGGAGSGGGDTG